MPKNKTHKSTAKRYRQTGTGKLMREQSGRRHIMEKMSNRIRRRLTGDVVVAKNDERRTKRLLGI